MPGRRYGEFVEVLQDFQAQAAQARLYHEVKVDLKCELFSYAIDEAALQGAGRDCTGVPPIASAHTGACDGVFLGLDRVPSDAPKVEVGQE